MRTYSYRAVEKRSKTTSLRLAGFAAVLLSLMLALGLATGPPAGAIGIDTGNLKIEDGVIEVGGMRVGNGCVRFDDGTTVGDCGDAGGNADRPERGDGPEGEESAEPPGQTLEDLAAECSRRDESTVPEDASGEQIAGVLTEELCQKILDALGSRGSGGEGEETGGTIPPGHQGTGDPGEQALPEETALEETTPERTPEGTTPDGRTTGEESSCPAAPPEDAQTATVSRAVDGDTLELSEEIEGTDTVRLIGVDAPETDDEVEPYGPEAAAFTAESLEGEEVLLELDEGEKDTYGRLLAYVWTEDGELFNEALLAGGYATLTIVEPNDRYAACLEAAELTARDAGVGLWGTEQDEPATEETTGPEAEDAPEPTDGEDGGREGLSGGTADFTSSGDGEPERTTAASPPSTLPEDSDEQTSPEAGGFGLTAPETTGEATPEGTTAAGQQYGPRQAAPETPPSAPPASEPEELTTSGLSGGFGLPEGRDLAGQLPTEELPQQISGQEPASTPLPTVEAALPTQQTPTGQQPVLPETGGPSPRGLLLIPGAVALVAGSLLLAALWASGRPGAAREDEERRGDRA
jgi:endonuclease YncB( thermonuclease family)